MNKALILEPIAGLRSSTHPWKPRRVCIRCGISASGGLRRLTMSTPLLSGTCDVCGDGNVPVATLKQLGSLDFQRLMRILQAGILRLPEGEYP